MCRHEASARLIAVQGFAHLLRTSAGPSTTSESLSLSQLSQSAYASTAHTAELYTEISAFMRRCMTQQLEIRQARPHTPHAYMHTHLEHILKTQAKLKFDS